MINDESSLLKINVSSEAVLHFCVIVSLIDIEFLRIKCFVTAEIICWKNFFIKFTVSITDIAVADVEMLPDFNELNLRYKYDVFSEKVIVIDVRMTVNVEMIVSSSVVVIVVMMTVIFAVEAVHTDF